MTKRERLRHQLEMQSMQIEAVFTRHQVPVRVAGGRVRGGGVTYDLQTEWESGLERLRALKQDLVTALGVPELHLNRQNGRWRLEIRQPTGQKVELLDLINLTPDLPPLTAVLGLAAHEAMGPQPVLLDLLAPDISHILISGGPKAGKTTLLRSMLLSLALGSRQAGLQMLVVDPGAAVTGLPTGKLLRPLNYLPHMLAPVIRTLDEVKDVFNFLLKEVAYRQQQKIKSPAIVLSIDELIALLELGGREISEPLTALLQQGADVGVRLILSANKASTPLLSRLMKAHLTVRLLGQMPDATEARIAAGIPDAQAEYLAGEGDFLAISHGSTLHFQAAQINDSDLLLCVNGLHRQRPPVLLAQPCQARPYLEPGSGSERASPGDAGANENTDFHFDEQGRPQFDDKVPSD
jgi:DNA segregation ATPase FtsK/SpoIIIE-like protein